MIQHLCLSLGVLGASGFEALHTSLHFQIRRPLSPMWDLSLEELES